MNPASRLLAIYDSLVSYGEDRPMVKVWARVFELDLDKQSIEDDLTACLVGLRGEIDFTRTLLSQHEVPLELTNPGFDRLKDVAAPARLHAAWSGLRGNVQVPECRQAFVWAEWVLRDEAEGDMPNEEMHALQAELESLEAGLEEAGMSPYLRDFVQRQVDTIRAALRLYRVQGARPLQEALTKVAGMYTVEGARVEAANAAASPEAKSVVAKTASFLKKTAEVCDQIDKLKKFGEGAYTLGATVAPLVLPYMGKMLGGS